jgi:hypothetical protein
MLATYTTRKLTNTNRNIDGIFMLVDYGELYRQTIYLLYSLVTTDGYFTNVKKLMQNQESSSQHVYEDLR